MKIACGILIGALSIAGCAPPGYVYDTGSFTPRPINDCVRKEAIEWMVYWLNQKVGEPEGPPAQVVSLSGLTVLIDDEAPAGTRVICHGTLQTAAGPAGPGVIVLNVAYSEETKTHYGSDASWELDTALRQKAAARTAPAAAPPASDPATVQFCEDTIFPGRPVDARSFRAMNAFRRCLLDHSPPVPIQTTAGDPARAAWEALREKPELREVCSTDLRYSSAITELRNHGATVNDLLRWAEQEAERSAADAPSSSLLPIGTQLMLTKLIQHSYLGTSIYKEIPGGFPQFAYRSCLKGKSLY